MVDPGELNYTFDYDVSDLLKMSKAVNYQHWILEIISDYIGDNILEVGAGIGNYTRYFLSKKRVYAIELSPSCLGILREKFQVDNIELLQMDAASPEILSLKVKNIDTIVCLNVLEHIQNDLLALKNFYQILCTPGYLILQLPALKFLYGNIDRQLGHYRRYTKKMIAEKVKQTNFKIERMDYINLIGTFGWFYDARIKGIINQNEQHVTFFDNRIVPIVRKFERNIEIPFGQSLIVILKKDQD
jgi:ubiquinone/menaquinone biosynthesis C-methylase UbiE